MKPVNNKSLLAFIFDVMEKVDKKETTVDEGKVQAQLSKQANNALRYELDRSNLLMKLDAHNALNTTKTKIELREAESKNFD